MRPRERKTKLFAADGTAVGLALVRDLDGEPACYDLQQFMIDRRFQGRGYVPDAPDSLNLVYRF